MQERAWLQSLSVNAGSVPHRVVLPQSFCAPANTRTPLRGVAALFRRGRTPNSRKRRLRQDVAASVPLGVTQPNTRSTWRSMRGLLRQQRCRAGRRGTTQRACGGEYRGIQGMCSALRGVVRSAVSGGGRPSDAGGLRDRREERGKTKGGMRFGIEPKRVRRLLNFQRIQYHSVGWCRRHHRDRTRAPCEAGCGAAADGKQSQAVASSARRP